MTLLGRIPLGRFLISLTLFLLDRAGKLPQSVERVVVTQSLVMMAEGPGGQQRSPGPSALSWGQQPDGESDAPAKPVQRPDPSTRDSQKHAAQLLPCKPLKQWVQLRQQLRKFRLLSKQLPTRPTSPRLPEGPRTRLGRLANALGNGLQQRSYQEYRRLRSSSTPKHAQNGPSPERSLLPGTTGKRSAARCLLGRRPR